MDTLCAVYKADIMTAISARHIRIYHKCHGDMPGLVGLNWLGRATAICCSNCPRVLVTVAPKSS